MTQEMRKLDTPNRLFLINLPPPPTHTFPPSPFSLLVKGRPKRRSKLGQDKKMQDIEEMKLLEGIAQWLERRTRD